MPKSSTTLPWLLNAAYWGHIAHIVHCLHLQLAILHEQHCIIVTPCFDPSIKRCESIHDD